MATDEIRLVCEGVIRGRDQRWLNLVLGTLAETFEPAAPYQSGRPGLGLIPVSSKAARPVKKITQVSSKARRPGMGLTSVISTPGRRGKKITQVSSKARRPGMGLTSVISTPA